MPCPTRRSSRHGLHPRRRPVRTRIRRGEGQSRAPHRVRPDHPARPTWLDTEARPCVVIISRPPGRRTRRISSIQRSAAPASKCDQMEIAYTRSSEPSSTGSGGSWLLWKNSTSRRFSCAQPIAPSLGSQPIQRTAGRARPNSRTIRPEEQPKSSAAPSRRRCRSLDRPEHEVRHRRVAAGRERTPRHGMHVVGRHRSAETRLLHDGRNTKIRAEVQHEVRPCPRVGHLPELGRRTVKQLRDRAIVVVVESLHQRLGRSADLVRILRQLVLFRIPRQYEPPQVRGRVLSPADPPACEPTCHACSDAPARAPLKAFEHDEECSRALDTSTLTAR